MYKFNYLIILIILFTLESKVNCNIWCYSCVSTQPGCDEFYVDWRIHKAKACPNPDDKCVKIIEKRKDETLITRDCLANLIGLRSDIPSDNFDGCRPAAKSNLAIYVDNNIKELDLKRNYFNKIEYCFCANDHWCNSTNNLKSSFILICIMYLIKKYFNNYF